MKIQLVQYPKKSIENNSKIWIQNTWDINLKAKNIWNLHTAGGRGFQCSCSLHFSGVYFNRRLTKSEYEKKKQPS